jgi:hypothetical protein
MQWSDQHHVAAEARQDRDLYQGDSRVAASDPLTVPRRSTYVYDDPNERILWHTTVRDSAKKLTQD